MNLKLFRLKNHFPLSFFHPADFKKFVSGFFSDRESARDFAWRDDNVISHAPVKSCNAIPQCHAQLPHKKKQRGNFIHPRMNTIGEWTLVRCHLAYSASRARDQSVNIYFFLKKRVYQINIRTGGYQSFLAQGISIGELGQKLFG